MESANRSWVLIACLHRRLYRKRRAQSRTGSHDSRHLQRVAEDDDAPMRDAPQSSTSRAADLGSPSRRKRCSVWRRSPQGNDNLSIGKSRFLASADLRALLVRFWTLGSDSYGHKCVLLRGRARVQMCLFTCMILPVVAVRAFPVLNCVGALVPGSVPRRPPTCLANGYVPAQGTGLVGRPRANDRRPPSHHLC